MLSVPPKTELNHVQIGLCKGNAQINHQNAVSICHGLQTIKRLSGGMIDLRAEFHGANY